VSAPRTDLAPPVTPRWAAALVVALAVLVLGAAVVHFDVLPSTGGELGTLGRLARFVGATLVVLLLPGIPLAWRFAPGPLRRWWPVLAIPFGLAAATAVLTALAMVGLRPRPATAVFLLLGALLAGRTFLPRWRRIPTGAPLDRPGTVAILAAACAVGGLGLIPVLRSQLITVMGQNPDAHQVVGVIWFLQEAHPLSTDLSTALDRVPRAWEGRIPIFHALGSATEIGLTGPIQMFTPFVAVLTAGFAAMAGLYAATALRLSGAGAGLVSLAIGGSSATIYTALHPYYNQLWGMLLLVTALTLAWAWLRGRDVRAGGLAIVFLLLAFVAYPSTLPYAALAIVAVGVAAWRLPPVPEGLARRLRRWLPAVVLIFGVSVVGALVKLGGVLSQFISGDPFWQGDVNILPPHGAAYGLTADTFVIPLVVAAGAVLALVWRDRRMAIPWAVLAVVLLAVDLILRDRSTAEYVDYKHVTFTAVLLLPLLVGGLVALVERGVTVGRAGVVVRWVPRVAAVAVLVAWAVPAVAASRDEVDRAHPNATAALLDIHRWSAELPAGSSVLIDLPASGTQLWATLFLGDRHPVASTDPVSSLTTYSVAPIGRRADFVLGLRRDLATGEPVPAPRWSVGRPVLSGHQFAIWRMRIPADVARTEPETASVKLVEPYPDPVPDQRVMLTRNPSTIDGFDRPPLRADGMGFAPPREAASGTR